MSDNEKIIKIFNKREPVTLSFDMEIKHNEEWLFKHMKPVSINWSATKGEPITVSCSFEKYIPTRWNLFKDWLHSKIYRCERYW
jgi:hypothetical protein